MKKTIAFSKDVAIHLSARPKTFEHPATIKLEISYEDAYDHSRDQDEFERQMMELGNSLKGVLRAYGTVDMPKDKQFEGSIDIRAKLDDDANLDHVIKKLEYSIASVSSKADGARAEHREAVQRGRMNSVTSALRDFMGTAIDDTNIDSIARRVLERLRAQNRGNGLAGPG